MEAEENPVKGQKETLNRMVGFHSHNNMDLAFVTAQDILEYATTRRLVVDCSLHGMGRGASNLQSELIANYYNITLGEKYDLSRILALIGKYILPIREKNIWGYSPYLLLILITIAILISPVIYWRTIRSV